MNKAFQRRLLVMLVVLATLNLSACGTILYPERKGTVSGTIDPAIAILDGLGLFLFIVPGVIAFAVDFTNGTIYLPDGAVRKLSAKEAPLIDLPDISFPEIDFPEINLPSIEFTDKQSQTDAKSHHLDALKLAVLKREILNAAAKYYDLPLSAFQMREIDTVEGLEWADFEWSGMEPVRLLVDAPRKS